MKRLFIAFICLGLALSACGKTESGDKEVKAHFEQLALFSATVELESHVGERVFSYVLAYNYDKSTEDLGVFLAPEEISGISFHVGQENSLRFDDKVLEMAQADIRGGTPADMLRGLVTTLASEVPTTLGREVVDKTTYLRLNYEGDPLSKTIWLTEDFDLFQAEVYLEGGLILRGKFSEYISG